MGGSVDAGAAVPDVFMIAMTFTNSGGAVVGNTVCSATLIGSRSLVTAAHCVDPARQAGAAAVTVKAVMKPNDAALMGSDLLTVTDIRLHPSWTAAATSATYDIAMVLLALVPPVAPRAINRAPLTGFVGQPVKLVGYGRTDPGNASSSGTRRLANATVTMLDANSFDFGAAGTLGICSGDSGGAALHTFPDQVERLIGVHSLTTSASCGSGSDTRVDFHLPFIDQWMSEKEGSVFDAGRPDSGSPVVDAGKPDAGAPDSGVVVVVDAGAAVDAGAPADAGTSVDAGVMAGTDGGLVPEAVGGCGCSVGAGPWPWLAAAVWLRRRSSRNTSSMRKT